MSEKIELLPCPFCGDDEIMDFQKHLENRVQCAMCNVSTDTFPSCEESHTAWNTRAKYTTAEPVQEAVKHDTKGSRKALGAMNAKLKAKIGRLERELATVKQSLTVEHVASSDDVAKDAARYQWLVKHSTYGIDYRQRPELTLQIYAPDHRDGLSAAIDAAMARGK